MVWRPVLALQDELTSSKGDRRFKQPRSQAMGRSVLNPVSNRRVAANVEALIPGGVWGLVVQDDARYEIDELIAISEGERRQTRSAKAPLCGEVDELS